MADSPRILDVVVIGAGQSGLAVGYFLHRHNRDVDRHGRRPLSFVLLDAYAERGGAWPRMWDSLRLFSPAEHSSLPGRRMPAAGEGNPPAAHVTRYLSDYESRYDLPVRRPVDVEGVETAADGTLLVRSPQLEEPLRTRHLVTATGTWSRPFLPAVPGAADFRGSSQHVVGYDRPEAYAGRRVLVVGGGNSGAQVAADLLIAQAEGRAAPAAVHWVTKRPPRYLPDDVDGRVLFETATQALRDLAEGREPAGVGSLGDIVAVPDVRRARDELGMAPHVGLERLTRDGAVLDGAGEIAVDDVVWATGFRSALAHLHGLGLAQHDGHPATRSWTDGAYPTLSTSRPDTWFVGHGDWCGPASATLVGVGRAARDTVQGLGDSLT